MLNTSNNSVIQIVKWFMLATLIGVVVGVLDAVFLKTLDAAIGARNKVPFFYLGKKMSIISQIIRGMVIFSLEFSTHKSFTNREFHSRVLYWFYALALIKV